MVNLATELELDWISALEDERDWGNLARIIGARDAFILYILTRKRQKKPEEDYNPN